MSGRRSHQGMFEFHVSARARDFYQFDLSLFSLSGNVIFANFQAARRFAEAMKLSATWCATRSRPLAPARLMPWA